MGAWDRLDTEISVETDTSDLDTAISNCDEYFTEDIKEYLQDLKKDVEEGSKNAVHDLAVRNRSFQQQIIAEVCTNPSGMLSSSIQEEEVGERTWLIGTIINHIYPLAVEYARGPVHPIRAKALVFYSDSGELIFRKSVGPAKARPFVAPAFEKTVDIADEIMLRYFGREST